MHSSKLNQDPSTSAGRIQTSRRKLPAPEPIALVGIGCQFPGGADDPDSFWQLLRAGVDAISEIPGDRWNLEAFHQASGSPEPGKSDSRWGGFIDRIDQFDARFFRISPREAAQMDPQQRLLLQVSWEALEDAGIDTRRLARSNTGVFVGASNQDYGLLQQPGRDLTHLEAHSGTGVALSILANRISHFFDFRGPSVTLDSACSSSLVALHCACSSLWEGECSLALAAGVNLLLSPFTYVSFSKASMLSPDGRCRSFDAGANGYVRGEGVGVVVLKPLAQARRDGDRIYALVLATAVNQDGHTSSLIVPSVDAQVELLRQGCQRAGISPHQVQYVEAHGTGTEVGDPIEATALGRVLGQASGRRSPCRIGSVKTNVGHLEPASGMAGLVKAALSLHHRQIPANLHFQTPNPRIPFQELNLQVAATQQPWPEAANGRRIAAVCSYGFGGTNGLAILEAVDEISAAAAKTSPGETAETSDDGRSFIVPISARSPEALKDLARSYRDFLSWGRGREYPLEDIACSAATRRSHLEERMAITASNRTELVSALETWLERGGHERVVCAKVLGPETRRLAFVFNGQGSQWWGMGRQLLEQEAVFREVIESCDEIIREVGGWSLLEELRRDEATSRLQQTAIAQPAIFALQSGLAALLQSWGIVPDAVVGHSLGETSAAQVAGCLTLEDATRLVFERAQAMETARPHGMMVAAALTAEEALELVADHPGVSLAAVNSAGLATLSGAQEPMEGLTGVLREKGIFHRRLDVDYAFHSSLLDPIRPRFLERLEGLPPRPGTIPLYSTVRAQQIEGTALTPDYWWENIRQAVLFGPVIEKMLKDEVGVFLELGAHPVLAGSLADCLPAAASNERIVGSLQRDKPDLAALSHCLSRLFCLGIEPGWQQLQPRPGRFRELPRYCWQKESAWRESDVSRHARLSPVCHPLLGRRVEPEHPVWEITLHPDGVPYLKDHRIEGDIIMPATAFLEQALAAGREIMGTTPFVLERFTLSNLCLLSDESGVVLRTSFNSREGLLTTLGQSSGFRNWVEHARCRITPRSAPGKNRPRALKLDKIRRRCPLEVGSEAGYRLLRAAGLDYGPAFQSLRSVHVGRQEALGEIRIPPDFSLDPDHYRAHPALVDACLQVAGLLWNWQDVGTRLLVPVEIGRACWWQEFDDQIWCHTRLCGSRFHDLVANLTIVNSKGEVLLELSGVRRNTLRLVAGLDSDEGILEYGWQPLIPLQAAPARRKPNLDRLIRKSAEKAPKEPGGEPEVKTDPQAGFRGSAGGSFNPLRQFSGSLRRRDLRAWQLVREYLRSIRSPRLLRVLEVGAATGLIVSRGVPAPAGRARFILADSSEPRMRWLEEQVAGKREISCFRLELEKDPTGRGLKAGSIDLILLLDGSGLGTDYGRSLDRLRTLLAPSGQLWVFPVDSPGATRSHRKLPLPCPLEADRDWSRILAEAGFASIQRRVLEHSPRIEWITAMAPVRKATTSMQTESDESPVETRAWILLPDQGEVGHRLGRLLEESGQKVLRVENLPRTSPAEPADEGEKVHDPELAARLAGLDMPLAGVLDLRALDLEKIDETADSSSLDRIGQATARWVEHLPLLDQLARTEPLRLCVVTRGSQVVRPRETPDLGQVPCWVLARVAAGELLGWKIVRVDLSAELSQPELQNLCGVLCRPPQGEELALRGDLVFRMRYRRAESLSTARKTDAPYRLTSRVAGSLQRLQRWQTRRVGPRGNQVEIEVDYAGINFADVMKALGIYPGLPVGALPLGAECAGTILRVGPRVRDLKPGMKVVAIAPFAMASHTRTIDDFVHPLPAGLSLSQAAGVPITFLTAHYSLCHQARLQAGERVLIHSASGGVGLAAIQIAHNCGAEIFATAGSPEKRTFLRSLGVHHVMDSRSLDFADHVRRITRGEGVDVVLNSLAGEAINKGLEVLRPHGRFVEIGKRDIYQDSSLSLRPFANQLSLMSVDLEALLISRPDLSAGLFREVMEQFEVGALTPPPCLVVPVAAAPTAFRAISQGRHIGKLVLSCKEIEATPPRIQVELPRFASGKSYLITGGLGGLGLELTRWLQIRGARDVVLLGRHPPEQASGLEIERFRKAGLRIHIYQVDVSDRDALAGVFRDLDRKRIRLSGIFHLAGLTDDCLLRDLTPERLREVWLPKVHGSWNLHQLTRDMKLDCFVLFSSASSFLGNPGQGSYASANAFLDGLAQYRRNQGLASLSIGWGLFDEVGMAARREGLLERMKEHGFKAMQPVWASHLVGNLLNASSAYLAVVQMDWRRFLELAGRDLPDRFADIASQLGTSSSASDGELRSRLANATPEELPELVRSVLRERLAKVLGTSVENIDMDCPVTELGLDSLMGIELRNWIEGQLELKLPTTQLLRGPTGNQLSDLLVNQVRTSRFGTAPPVSQLPAANAEPPDRLKSEDIDQLGEEQIDQLLAQELAHRDSSSGFRRESESSP